MQPAYHVKGESNLSVLFIDVLLYRDGISPQQLFR